MHLQRKGGVAMENWEEGTVDESEEHFKLFYKDTGLWRN